MKYRVFGVFRNGQKFTIDCKSDRGLAVEKCIEYESKGCRVALIRDMKAIEYRSPI